MSTNKMTKLPQSQSTDVQLSQSPSIRSYSNRSQTSSMSRKHRHTPLLPLDRKIIIGTPKR